MPDEPRERHARIELIAVYDYCPPTLTEYHSANGRQEYEAQWAQVLEQLGLRLEAFAGKTLLDIGCGSCEKAVFYADWGASVTAVDVTPAVLAKARDVLGSRPIRLVQGSLFDLPEERFDIVIADGVLHHTYDTRKALERVCGMVKDGGILVVSLVNVWGRFWWFPVARRVTRAIGGSNFHRRAAWGRRLFAWTRSAHESTEATGGFARSEDSWAYDWFANPRWNAHTPAQLRRWMTELGLQHTSSVPALFHKGPPKSRAAAALRLIAGDGTAMMTPYWLVNREPNTLYFVATKTEERA